jgi:hypothetical protein
MKQLLLLLIFFHTCHKIAKGQTLTNAIKGSVVDAQSGSILPGATVILVGSDPLKGANADLEGRFNLTSVPVGRHSVLVSFIGYANQLIPNILVTSGKEVVIEVRLQEQVQKSEEAVIRANRDPTVLNNEFTTLSARSFDVENTRRFAGSRNDPSRMAANFAGVVGNNDARNDIVIRGNSPTGLLWRLEEIDIPNPSHYGALGATGGPVGILNNNVLGRSDFMTGAFPAMYGNALSGVFDLRLRNGNRDKREFTGQIGFNGFELGLEGPFQKGKRGTYVAHYRYSVIGLVSKLGLSSGTGASIPYYQDLSFKVNLPGKKPGNAWNLFGVGGISSINFKGDLKDTANFYNDPYHNLKNEASMGVVGTSYVHYFNSGTFLKTTLAASGSTFSTVIDSLNKERIAIPSYRDYSSQGRATLSVIYNRKVNARHLLSTGAYIHKLYFDLLDSVYTARQFKTLRNEKGSTELVQGYAQWQFKPTDLLTFNGGLHYTLLTLNAKQALEPRISARYQLTQTQAVSLAGSMNSQLQPMQSYFYKTRLLDGNDVLTNKQMGLTKSIQGILAYERTLGSEVRVKAEAYYQHMYNIPVETRASSFSILNLGATFGSPNMDSLVNEGLGRNFGLELTLERNYSEGYYFLGTLSLYDSKYKGSDNILRNTAFNGHYVLNLLAGKEIKIGEKGTFALDLKLAVAGGRKYTPIDLNASIAKGQQVQDDSRAYSQNFKQYFRPDLKLTYRYNGKKMSQEWFLDLQNLSNSKNIFAQTFDPNSNKVRMQYQTGFYPNFNYRIEF